MRLDGSRVGNRQGVADLASAQGSAAWWLAADRSSVNAA